MTIQDDLATFNYDMITNKLIILFLLDKIEIPLTENSIIDILSTKNNWINYMECKSLIYSLIKAKFIFVPNENADEPFHTLTYQGRSCLNLFFQKIPNELREKIATFAKNNMMHIKRKQEYISSFQKNADGSYMASFIIREPILSKSILEIKVKMDNRPAVIDSAQKWLDKAPDVYSFIYDTLLSE